LKLELLWYPNWTGIQTIEGTPHPDRDAQFRHLNDQVRRFVQRHDPAVSVDTKKNNSWDPSRIGDGAVSAWAIRRP
jgi:hypothetical protein